MSSYFESWICEICGKHRRQHNELEKDKCSKIRKKLHENDDRRKPSKQPQYTDTTIKYFAGNK